jgi:hypothetical protein
MYCSRGQHLVQCIRNDLKSFDYNVPLPLVGCCS